ncbi:MAG: hypothetical protein Athens101428_266 [Candidatus Berkelbacteria bacterium Athens1014_28]|uniref:Uncharacterized protein n=1 Tax=Candidatus Berkelbacteria bacterium Athens1014_28 TaxID=2017145 RepID=A0A554LNR3_9BACT|nr:MAG: hypothetical protein Athens101428_266 [Candidatus Berkelbacteria bacterium Athens1014_28]
MDDVNNQQNVVVSPPVTDAGVSDQQLQSVLDDYKNQLLSELGADSWTAEEKKEVEEKIATLVNDRVLNLLLIYLPEDKIADLDKVIETDDQEAIAKYLSENIPDVGEKIANELMEIRSDIINKFKK